MAETTWSRRRAAAAALAAAALLAVAREALQQQAGALGGGGWTLVRSGVPAAPPAINGTADWRERCSSTAVSSWLQDDPCYGEADVRLCGCAKRRSVAGGRAGLGRFTYALRDAAGRAALTAREPIHLRTLLNDFATIMDVIYFAFVAKRISFLSYLEINQSRRSKK